MFKTLHQVMLGKRYFLGLILTGLLLVVSSYVTSATVYPSYNTEADCRGCHGSDVSDRHHLLVVNGLFQCTNCHRMIYDNSTQTYSPELIRNCLVCHPGKNHADTHHIFASQGLFVCSDCHPVVYDNSTQTYSTQVTWDCTVCHSTVLSIQNTTPTPTPSPTPTPTSMPSSPPSPTITNFTPISPVNNIIGDSRSFEIMTDQIVDVIWLVNDAQVHSNASVTDAIYTNMSASLGIWNVTAIASNINGTVMHNWSWNVTAPIPAIIDITLPSISITSPKNKQKFTSAAVTISGIASDNVALNEVEVKVGSGSYQTATGTASWSKSVTLASGSNTIYSRATDKSGNTKETSIKITYNKK